MVVEVPEPEPEALDVLDDQVGAFGGGVGEPGAVAAKDGTSQRAMVPASRSSSGTWLRAQWS